MNIGIYNPYLDILGGGEKYTFDIARFFLKKDFRVDFFWDERNIKEKAENRYNLDLDRLIFQANIFKNKKGFLTRLKVLSRYDLFFYVTDGSLFWPWSKKNISIIQSPAHIPSKTLINQLKIRNWDLIFCYSEFVKKFIDKQWPAKTLVLPPSIDTDQFKPFKKENLIISVGRFTKSLHSKKQEVLISTFKKISSKFPDLRLILAGGLIKDDENYFKKLKEQAKNFSVEFYPNIDFKTLRDFYGRAEIYWHAAGFGEDLDNHPEKAEHFGITTIEAMAAGCVPVVFRAGGQTEIIKEGDNGFFWETEKELVALTSNILVDDQKRLKMSFRAIERSRDFSEKIFEKKLTELLCF